MIYWNLERYLKKHLNRDASVKQDLSQVQHLTTKRHIRNPLKYLK